MNLPTIIWRWEVPSPDGQLVQWLLYQLPYVPQPHKAPISVVRFRLSLATLQADGTLHSVDADLSAEDLLALVALLGDARASLLADYRITGKVG